MTLANGCPLKVWKTLHASIKVAFEEVSQQHPGVQWQRSARWCVDGKFLTSSGEAGIRKPAVLDLVVLVVEGLGLVVEGLGLVVEGLGLVVFWWIVKSEVLGVGEPMVKLGFVCLEDGCDWILKV